MKWSLGNGTIFEWIFLKSAFNYPGNLIEHVVPPIAADAKWFKSPKVGVVNLSVLKQISYNASLSIHVTKSTLSIN